MTASLYDVTKRGFIGGTIGTASVGAPPAPRRPPPAQAHQHRRQQNRLTSFSKSTAIACLEPRTSLLDALRENVGLMGTETGCDRGACGACTVQVDGRRVVSCLTLAAHCHGKSITTIEGLAIGDTSHHAEIHEWMSGNICRCRAHPNIVAAIRDVSLAD